MPFIEHIHLSFELVEIKAQSSSKVSHAPSYIDMADRIIRPRIHVLTLLVLIRFLYRTSASSEGSDIPMNLQMYYMKLLANLLSLFYTHVSPYTLTDSFLADASKKTSK